MVIVGGIRAELTGVPVAYGNMDIRTAAPVRATTTRPTTRRGYPRAYVRWTTRRNPSSCSDASPTAASAWALISHRFPSMTRRTPTTC